MNLTQSNIKNNIDNYEFNNLNKFLYLFHRLVPLNSFKIIKIAKIKGFTNKATLR